MSNFIWIFVYSLKLHGLQWSFCICSCLNECCTYGQFDIQPVDMYRASTILSHLYLLCSLQSILNQVCQAKLVAKCCSDALVNKCNLLCKCTHFWQLVHCIELLQTPLPQTPHGHLIAFCVTFCHSPLIITLVFTAWCTIVQSTVLRSHVVHPPARPSAKSVSQLFTGSFIFCLNVSNY